MKIIKTESGARLPATYRSGRYEEWKSRSKVAMPRVGETEDVGAAARARGCGGGGEMRGKKFLHKGETPAKPLHKLNKDYERKTRQLGKKMESKGAGGGGEPSQPESRGGRRSNLKGPQKTSRYSGKPIGRVRSELKSAEQIRKTRQLAEKKKAKNARPSKRGRK